MLPIITYLQTRARRILEMGERWQGGLTFNLAVEYSCIAVPRRTVELNH